MKEFNLEECMKGKPVVTRDGRPYKFGAYNPDAPTWKLAGWIDGSVYAHANSGMYHGGCSNSQSSHDLFMASCKKDGWIILFDQGNGYRLNPSTVFKSEEEADNEAQRIKQRFIDEIANYVIHKIELPE